MQKALLISLLHVSKQNPNFLMDASKCLKTDSVSELNYYHYQESSLTLRVQRTSVSRLQI